MLGALIDIGPGLGYAGVFALVAAETAGALVPGETALIVAGVVASEGHLSLPLVIAAGAGGAICGDSIGFLIGGRALRRLLKREGRWARARALFVAEGEAFFRRHGPKAVFLARWLPGLRLTGAWFAGAHRMPWKQFALWNAAGGIAWAASIAGGAFLLGEAAGGVFGLVGAALAALAVTVVGSRFAVRRRRRRRATAGPQDPG